jgi:hypothetical protein
MNCPYDCSNTSHTSLQMSSWIFFDLTQKEKGFIPSAVRREESL